MRRPSPPVAIAIALPVLLALVVAGIAVTARFGGFGSLDAAAAPAVEGPLTLAPVDAPDAGSVSCTTLLIKLDGDLPAGRETLPQRAIAEPVQPGARAWAASPRPVVLRCGLPRPVELTPSSPLLVINGVSWLQLDDGIPDPVVLTYVTVDRPVYVVLTTPVAAGSGPLQQVSDVVRTNLPSTPVAVR